MTTLAQNQTSEQTAIVAFNGASLITAKIKEIIYVALRPIVEALGLDWKVQHRKINTSTRYGHMTIPLQTVGGIQEMLCIPLRKLNGWLFSINPSKVREDLRERVAQYQEECFEVLYRYWNEGIVINPRQDLHFQIPDIIHELVSQGVAAKGTLYNRLYRRFNVNSYKDIPLEQGQAAIEYLKRMASIYSQKLPVILNDGEHYFVVKDGVVIWEKVLKSNCDDIPVNTLKNPALMLEHIRQVVGEFIGKGALPAPKPVLIADFSKNSVFEHKYQGRRYVLSLDVFGNGYGWEGNPLRRLFALLKQAKKDGTTVAVNDIEGAELVFSTTESLARQYKDSLDSVSRHAANASNTACYLPLQGC